MPPATFDETTVDVEAAKYLFRVKGSVPKFAGWMAVYNQEPAEDRTAGPGPDAASADDEDGANVLPALNEGDRLELRALKPEQKFTQPPPRYSEATLVKALEENGIGRPSTYASIIGVIQTREYVNKIEARFKPTLLGMMLVEKLLSPAFDDILDVNYTRELEEELDKIEGGTNDYESALSSFYKKFEKDLKRAAKDMINLKEGVEPDPEGRLRQVRLADGDQGREVRPVPGLQRVSGVREHARARDARGERRGRGDRRELRELRQADGAQARALRSVPGLHRLPGVQDDAQDHRDEAGLGGGEAGPDARREMPEVRVEPGAQAGPVRRVHRLQQLPACKYVKQKSTGVLCPKDGGDIVERKSRRGRVFYGCANYPACDFTLWNRPMPEKCPDCGAPFLVEKITKRHGRQLICNNEECSYVRSEELAPV